MEFRDVTVDDEQEDEDIPSDFFDDFSNQDFMAGLDVVDAWDDEEIYLGNPAADASPQQDKGIIKKNTPPNRRRAGRRIRARAKRKPNSRLQFDNKRQKSEDTLKRDPEKTKRDIQKDKDRWTKNNKAQIISEKLRVVETGLVPPGTEMDDDVEYPPIRTDPDVLDLREKINKKRRSSSFDLTTRLAPRRSPDRRRSPVRRGNRAHSRSRSRPLHRRSSLNRRSDSRNRRLPLQRSSSPRRLSREQRIESEHRRRLRDLSPNSPRRYGRLQSPNDLDRLARMHDHDRNDYRKRSASPLHMNNRRRNTPKDFLEELADKLKYDEKKKSFLKEISNKLNDSRPNPHMNRMYGPGPLHMPGPMHMPGPNMAMAPGPVPPAHYFQPNDPLPQYDQSFFIGQPDSFRPPNPNSNFAPLFVQDNFEPLLNLPPKIVPQPVHPPHNQFRNMNNTSREIASKTGTNMFATQQAQDKKAASKLLEEKNLSLSDYLSMSVNYNAGSSKPVNIQKKIKVLAKCQDAIKAMDSAKLRGRFFYAKSNSIGTEQTSDMKYLSPLRKIPVTRFTFTTAWRGKEEKTTPPTALHKLLISMGLNNALSSSNLTNQSSVIDEPDCNIDNANNPKVFTPTPLVAPRPSVATIVRFLSKLCQTDPVKCENCEARKAIKFSTNSTQCLIGTTDRATQITEEDVHRYGFKLGVSKNKSLAHMTPAQLLGKDEPQRRELFPITRMTTPPPPNITPEKANTRLDYPARRAAAKNVPAAPSLIEQLQLSMKSFQSNPGGRSNYVNMNEGNRNVSREVTLANPSEFKHQPDFNRPSEFREHSPSDLMQHRMYPDKHNIRMQQDSFFEAQQNYYPQAPAQQRRFF